MLSHLPSKKEVALIHKAQILGAIDRVLLKKIFGFTPGDIPGGVVREWGESDITLEGKTKVPLFTLDPKASRILIEKAKDLGYYTDKDSSSPQDASLHIIEALGENLKELRKELKRLDKLIYG